MFLRILPTFVLFITTTIFVAGQDRQSSKWTTQAVENKSSATQQNDGDGILRKVRAARQKGFDRVVFEFGGVVLPDYKVGFEKPPFYLGESGKTVKISGKLFLEILFTNAAAHDLTSGKPTVTAPGRLSKLPVLSEVRQIYDFEGQIRYVLGLKNKRSFRVMTLSNPVRVVVDVKHQ